jgi:hypothetical protein
MLTKLAVVSMMLVFFSSIAANAVSEPTQSMSHEAASISKSTPTGMSSQNFSFTSCWDECYQFNFICPEQCRISQSYCADLTQVCYNSCDQGIGPWLPC